MAEGHNRGGIWGGISPSPLGLGSGKELCYETMERKLEGHCPSSSKSEGHLPTSRTYESINLMFLIDTEKTAPSRKSVC